MGLPFTQVRHLSQWYHILWAIPGMLLLVWSAKLYNPTQAYLRLQLLRMRRYFSTIDADNHDPRLFDEVMESVGKSAELVKASTGEMKENSD